MHRASRTRRRCSPRRTWPDQRRAEAYFVARVLVLVVELQRAADPLIARDEFVELHRALHEHHLDLAAVELQAVDDVGNTHPRLAIGAQLDFGRTAARPGRARGHAQLRVVVAGRRCGRERRQAAYRGREHRSDAGGGRFHFSCSMVPTRHSRRMNPVKPLRGWFISAALRPSSLPEPWGAPPCAPETRSGSSAPRCRCRDACSSSSP